MAADNITTLPVSIHAPPRGATDRVFDFPRRFKVSIHAPPRGATPVGSFMAWGKGFQSTPLREGRRNAGVYRNGTYNVSIHAPPRGAT